LDSSAFPYFNQIEIIFFVNFDYLTKELCDCVIN